MCLPCMFLLNMVALYGLAEAMRLLSRSACEPGSDYSSNRDMQGRHMDYLQEFAFLFEFSLYAIKTIAPLIASVILREVALC